MDDGAVSLPALTIALERNYPRVTRRNPHLAKPIDDSRLVQIVRGHFQLYPIAVRETDEPLPHLSRNMSENLMLIRQLNPEHRSSEDGGDFTLGFDCLFCRHDLKRYFRVSALNGGKK